MRWPLVLTVVALAGVSGLVGIVLATGSASPLEPIPPAPAGRPLPQGGMLRQAIRQPLGDLNLLTTFSTAAALVLDRTHDRLADRDPQTGALRPGVALRWQRADGPAGRWRIELRAGLRFADGAPVLDVDLEFAFACARAAGVATGRYTDGLEAVETLRAEGGRLLAVELSDPRRERLEEFLTSYPIVQRAYHVDAVRRAAADPSITGPGSPGFGEALGKVAGSGPGTGPYRIARRLDGTAAVVPDEEVVLVRNGESWHHAARPRSWNLDLLVVRFIADPAARRAGLRRGELDIVSGSGIGAWLAGDPALAGELVLHRYDSAANGQHLIVWNCRRPPLDRPRVRRALTALVDQDLVVDGFLGGDARRAWGWFKRDTPAYPDASAAPQASVEAARQQLEGTGIGPQQPVTIELLCASELDLHVQVAQAMATAGKPLGLDIVPRTMPYAKLVARRADGDFHGYFTYWGHGDEAIDPADVFRSDAPDNHSGWSSAAADALLETAAQADDADERDALYRRFGVLLLEEAPVTLLAHPLNAVLVHRRFQDVIVGPRGLSMERAWVPAERRLPAGRLR